MVECHLFDEDLLDFLDSPTFVGVTVETLIWLLVTVAVSL